MAGWEQTRGLRETTGREGWEHEGGHFHVNISFVGVECLVLPPAPALPPPPVPPTGVTLGGGGGSCGGPWGPG